MQVVAQAALVAPGLRCPCSSSRSSSVTVDAGQQHRLAAQQVRRGRASARSAISKYLGSGQARTRGAAARVRPPLPAIFSFSTTSPPANTMLRTWPSRFDRRPRAASTARWSPTRPRRAGRRRTRRRRRVPLSNLPPACRRVKTISTVGAFSSGCRPNGNAAAVVLDADRTVGVQRHVDALAVAGERLVGRVVDHLLDDVQRVVGARVHARPLLDRLQALEDADRRFAVVAGGLAVACLPWARILGAAAGGAPGAALALHDGVLQARSISARRPAPGRRPTPPPGRTRADATRRGHSRDDELGVTGSAADGPLHSPRSRRGGADQVVADGAKNPRREFGVYDRLDQPSTLR